MRARYKDNKSRLKRQDGSLAKKIANIAYLPTELYLASVLSSQLDNAVYGAMNAKNTGLNLASDGSDPNCDEIEEAAAELERKKAAEEEQKRKEEEARRKKELEDTLDKQKKEIVKLPKAKDLEPDPDAEEAAIQSDYITLYNDMIYCTVDKGWQWSFKWKTSLSETQDAYASCDPGEYKEVTLVDG